MSQFNIESRPKKKNREKVDAAIKIKQININYTSHTEWEFIFINENVLQMMKIDHHRGPVTSVQVCQASDVLVSSSHDATICLWSLENFTLLNLIQMNSPVMNIRISSDSVSIYLLFVLFAISVNRYLNIMPVLYK